MVGNDVSAAVPVSGGGRAGGAFWARGASLPCEPAVSVERHQATRAGARRPDLPARTGPAFSWIDARRRARGAMGAASDFRLLGDARRDRRHAGQSARQPSRWLDAVDVAGAAGAGAAGPAVPSRRVGQRAIHRQRRHEGRAEQFLARRRNHLPGHCGPRTPQRPADLHREAEFARARRRTLLQAHYDQLEGGGRIAFGNAEPIDARAPLRESSVRASSAASRCPRSSRSRSCI